MSEYSSTPTGEETTADGQVGASVCPRVDLVTIIHRFGGRRGLSQQRLYLSARGLGINPPSYATTWNRCSISQISSLLRYPFRQRNRLGSQTRKILYSLSYHPQAPSVETLAPLNSSNRFEALKMLPHSGFPGPDSAPDTNGCLQLYRDSKHIGHRGCNL